MCRNPLQPSIRRCRRSPARWLWAPLIAPLALCLLTERADALDVYRIGGADQPPPPGPGVEFHQLSWQDLTEQEGLGEAALADSRLQPFLLDDDENLGPTTLARGGGPNVSGNVGYYVTEPAKLMVDGKPGTYYEWVKTSQSLTITHLAQHRITVDLGSIFQVNRIRLIAAGDSQYPDRLDVNSETVFIPTRRHALTGEPIAQVLENVSDTIDVRFPPVEARSIGLMLHRRTPKAVKVAELEIYGQGYVDQASYIGPFVDAGEPAIWGNMRWGGRQDDGAEVRIRTRTGRTLDPNRYWRFTGRGAEVTDLDADGQPLTATTYSLLKPGEEAEITYDTDNWSFWTAPYDFADSSGAAILSSTPKPVIQVRVDFLSRGDYGGQLDFVEFTATQPPLAATVAGEIHPVEVQLGSTPRFTYALVPTIRGSQSGFDQVEISTPFGFAGIDTVRLDRAVVDDFELLVEQADSTRFAVQLPDRLGTADSGRLLEVVFRAPVLRYATRFQGWVRDSQRPGELPQRITAGDAAANLSSESLSVRTTLSDQLLGNLAAPTIFTPNGDGSNDQAVFTFNLLQLTDTAPLNLVIYDLAGRPVTTRSESVAGSGRFRFEWDGRDDFGVTVPPGIYLYRIAVDAGKGEDAQAGTIGVAY